MAEAQTLFGFNPENEETEPPSGRSEDAPVISQTSKAGSPSKGADVLGEPQPPEVRQHYWVNLIWEKVVVNNL